ncbi:SpoIIE family protein phosphatase [Paenibacillus sp. Soil522]|uniref:SpoIIE family protein phosphatase n=1 Tax=Paenibacillus sp. Soil522 TaxID=1736388 RepID=UPI0012DDCF66|nr:SpoIIE family protein phosphatase [Paenibacillus sp. Soil522]
MISYGDHMKIILYTDGLSESMGDNGEDKLDLLVEQLSSRESAEPSAIVRDFISGQNSDNQKDDICLVMIAEK